MSMTPRERALTALRGGVPDRIPKQFNFGPEPQEGPLKGFDKVANGKSPAEFFDNEVRGAGLGPTKLTTDFTRFYEELPEGSEIDEWGIAKIPGSIKGFFLPQSPMSDFTSIEEVEAYPFPDIAADYRYEEVKIKVRQFREAGYASMTFITSHNYVAAWQLRGMEDFMMDMIANPKMAEAVIDRTTEMSCRMAEKLAYAEVDIIYYGEDMASQRGPVMSLEMWRDWLKPRLKKVIDAAHNANPDIIFKYHSDGDVTTVIPDLIDAGIDVLNPLQPECMDVARIKEEYGSEIAFWGGLERAADIAVRYSGRCAKRGQRAYKNRRQKRRLPDFAVACFGERGFA